jgi:hypothetical protein
MNRFGRAVVRIGAVRRIITDVSGTSTTGPQASTLKESASKLKDDFQAKSGVGQQDNHASMKNDQMGGTTSDRQTFANVGNLSKDQKSPLDTGKTLGNDFQANQSPKHDNMKQDNLKQDNLKQDNLKQDNWKQDNNMKQDNWKQDNNIKQDNWKQDNNMKQDNINKNPSSMR